MTRRGITRTRTRTSTSVKKKKVETGGERHAMVDMTQSPRDCQRLRYCTVLYCTVLYCTVLYCTFRFAQCQNCHTSTHCTVWTAHSTVPVRVSGSERFRFSAVLHPSHSRYEYSYSQALWICGGSREEVTRLRVKYYFEYDKGLEITTASKPCTRIFDFNNPKTRTVPLSQVQTVHLTVLVLYVAGSP